MSEAAFSLSRHPGGVAVIELGVPQSPLNLLRPAHCGELSELLDALPAARALVLTSGAGRAFCAGADLHELTRVQAVQDGIDLARDVQRTLDRIVQLEVPVVAAIDGPCLGVGASLALVADARVATTSDRTRIGFPEVRLGLVPVAAAERLIGQVGLKLALELLLGGRLLSGERARAARLVDDVVAPGIVVEVALELARKLARERHQETGWTGLLRERASALRRRVLAGRVHRVVALREARLAVQRRQFGLHAAPERLLDVVRAGLERGTEGGLEAERRAFGELLVSPEAGHLMQLHLETHAVARGRRHGEKPARAPVEGIGVVGANPDAVPLVARAARSGLAVRLRGHSSLAVADTLRELRARLESEVSAGTLDWREGERLLGRVTVTVGRDGFRGLPFVLALAPDRAGTWSPALEDLEHSGPREGVLACLTSATPVATITAGARVPQHVVGWVPAEPVAGIHLLELAVARPIRPAVLATALAVARKTGHTPIVVHDAPFFFTPRLLGAWLNEGLRLVAEGVPAARVDGALTDWGFARGPIATLRALGPDRALRTLRELAAAFGDRHGLPQTAERLLERGDFSAPTARATAISRSEVVERCAMRMVNEAILCFGEGVIESARDANVAGVYGAGFPAFRGGPLRHVDAIGIAETVHRLERLRRAHGRRFTPANLVVRMTRSGGSFHGDARVQPGSEREGAGG